MRPFFATKSRIQQGLIAIVNVTPKDTFWSPCRVSEGHQTEHIASKLYHSGLVPSELLQRNRDERQRVSNWGSLAPPWPEP